jgi:hypothetical protein
MADKPRDGNVRPSRKGVEIPEIARLEPIEELVVLTAALHKLALSGTLRDLAYVGITPDLSEFRLCGVVGEEYNFTLMDSLLRHVTTMHYENVVFPIFMGEEFEDDE